jgi:putative addiction module killer protein
MIYHTIKFVKYELAKTPEYLDWFDGLASKDRLQIDARLDRVAIEAHFGTWRYLGDKVSELKFNNGIRIYFGIVKREKETVLLVLGGNKSGQEKDIKKAKKIFQRETTSD